MMPLSFAALISGMMTLVATAPYLVVNSELGATGQGARFSVLQLHAFWRADPDPGHRVYDVCTALAGGRPGKRNRPAARAWPVDRAVQACRRDHDLG